MTKILYKLYCEFGKSNLLYECNGETQTYRYVFQVTNKLPVLENKDSFLLLCLKLCITGIMFPRFSNCLFQLQYSMINSYICLHMTVKRYKFHTFTKIF